MIIEYETDKYISEKQEIEIKDTKNVFLKGRNILNGFTTYFGIWIHDGGLSIVTIIRYTIIYYHYYSDLNFCTKCDIKEYLKNSQDVRIIEKSEFKKQIEHIMTILKI